MKYCELTNHDNDRIRDLIGALDFQASFSDPKQAKQIYRKLDSLRAILSDARKREICGPPPRPTTLEPFRLRGDR